MLRILYNLCTLFLTIPAAVMLALKARGRRRFFERFGCWRDLAGRFIWVHAASVGEVNGVLPLINEIKLQFPSRKILLTATSATGLDRAANQVAELRLLPFDCWLWYHFALKNVEIECLLISETELWPELIWTAKASHSPVAMINATISEYSWPNYLRFKCLISKILNKIDLILCANKVSQSRFEFLSSVSNKIIELGNTKYDIQPKFKAQHKAANRKLLGCDTGSILLLASLREGEEQFWLPHLQQTILTKNFKIVLAPRHPEETSYFQGQLKAQQIKYRLFTDLESSSAAPTQVILLNVLGKLEEAYSIADFAFVGGSLVDFGGHNPLEPAAYAVPIAMGKYTSNISELIEIFKSQNAIKIVETSQDCLRILQELVINPQIYQQQGQGAFEIWRNFSGVTLKALSLLQKKQILSAEKY